MTMEHEGSRIERPTYAEVLTALESWRSRNRLADPHIRAVDEVQVRLRRLDLDLGRLLDLNSHLLASDAPAVRVDQESNELKVEMGGQSFVINLPAADPAVPIQVRGMASTVGFIAGAQRDADSEPVKALKAELSALLEAYYYNAHRVLKIIQQLPGLRNTKSKGVTIVRNKLIEHADHGAIYSFGASSAGPVIGPISRPGREWSDAGLIPNTAEFVTSLALAFQK